MFHSIAFPIGCCILLKSYFTRAWASVMYGTFDKSFDMYKSEWANA